MQDKCQAPRQRSIKRLIEWKLCLRRKANDQTLDTAIAELRNYRPETSHHKWRADVQERMAALIASKHKQGNLYPMPSDKRPEMHSTRRAST